MKVKCKALVSSIGTHALKKGGEYYFTVEEATDLSKRGYLEVLEIPEPEIKLSTPKKRPSRRRKKNDE